MDTLREAGGEAWRGSTYFNCDQGRARIAAVNIHTGMAPTEESIHTVSSVL